jgi:hypothetical protein
MPIAILVGAGGINALTGEKLGTKLEKDNYLVTPPQPWLDGWKDKDGTVYQFVATPYKKGKGISVAEQLIGKESKTGALGIAVFDAKDHSKLSPKHIGHEGTIGSAYTDYYGGVMASCSLGPSESTTNVNKLHSEGQPITKSLLRSRSTKTFDEMGIGKGGKIIQKIYPDPHGLEVWKEKPAATLAVYLVNAMVFEEITGKQVPIPVGHETYDGHWFGLPDKQEGDVAGSGKFTGLKSAVFPASDLTVEDKKKKEKEAVAK